MKRYFIRVGDKTTADGIVTQGEDNFKHHGVSVSYHGAAIYCHGCKTVGHICSVPPYRPFSILGKQVALDNDICICKCSPPPRLIASQNTAFMSFDGEELSKMGFSSNGMALQKTSEPPAFDDRFQLLDAETGEPLVGFEYAIERANGEVEHGVTDSDGNTHLLSATEHAESINFYI